MTTTSPLNGLPCPDDSSPNDPPIHFQALNDALDDRLLPHFPTAADRDTAFSNWVAAGGVMRNWMQCTVDNLGLQQYFGGAWSTVLTPSMYPLGLIKTATSSAATGTAAAAEQRLTGPQNIGGIALSAGRTYEVVARGNVQSSGPSAGAILAVRVRAAKGATPTTTSAAVAGAQPYVPTSTAAGAVSWIAGGEFQVGVSGSDWQIHLFGTVLSVATAMTVTPDARGVISISVYDRGPATSDVPAI